MSLFKEMINTQAFLKCGLLGFAGSGKTTTAGNIAIGLIQYLVERNIVGSNKPAFFLDTETGSDWLIPKFKDAGIKMMAAKTRAFSDLVPSLREAEKEASVLIIDSISHFWKELTESYTRKNNKKYLTFPDWNYLKGEWGKFTELFVNSNLHIIMCGRAGYEYDFFDGDNGKKELEKTGIKMKAESETGYETSLTVLMERHEELGIGGKLEKQFRTANILKDRSGKIDGKQFINPSFKEFLPHIEFLNLGGEQLGIENRSSDGMFETESKDNWQLIKQKKEVALDEIKEIIYKHHPSSSADDKKSRVRLLEEVCNTPSWSKFETFPLDEVERCRNALWLKLEGHDYHFVLPSKVTEIDANEDIAA